MGKPIRLNNVRASHFQRPYHNSNMAMNLTKEVWWSLLVDTSKRAEDAAEKIGVCLELEAGTLADLQQANTILKRWYSHPLGRQPHTSCTDLENVLGD